MSKLLVLEEPVFVVAAQPAIAADESRSSVLAGIALVGVVLRQTAVAVFDLLQFLVSAVRTTAGGSAGLAATGDA